MTKVGLRKGAWTAEEDDLLKQCIQTYGEGNWYLIPDRAGLKRCRKSCRMRWLNYLKPGINRGELEEDEVDLILRLHKVLGNKWSLIAGRLPGRTCSNIKNYWYTYIAKKLPKVAAESTISQGNNKKQQEEEEEEEDLVKVKAIRPIARRPTKTMQFDMNVTSDQPPPPLHGGIIAEENWWKRLVEEDNNDFGFGGGNCSASGSGGHCTTAANYGYDLHIGSPSAAGGGFTDDGDNPDGELYIDNIFQP